MKKQNRFSILPMRILLSFCTAVLLFTTAATPAFSEEDTEGSGGGADGSNPLSSTSKLDLVWQFTKPGGSHVNKMSAKGSAMLHPKVKFVYELNYLVSDVSGTQENDWESLNLKPIFFAKDAKLSDTWGLRLALGAELILRFEGPGFGLGTNENQPPINQQSLANTNRSDEIAPLVGFAFMNFKTKTVLIPLVQHFESYEDGTVSQTAFRLIALQPLPNGYWAKLDAKTPWDWENDELPANGEFEFGKMFTPSVGIFTQALAGFGSDRPFDWGAAGAVRFNF